MEDEETLMETLLGQELIENLYNVPLLSKYRSLEEWDTDISKNSCIANINIRSINKNHEALAEAIATLKNINGLTCIILTEIHNAPSNIRNKYVPGFNYESKTRETGSKKGGVGLLINQNVNYEVIEELSPFVEGCLESICIHLKETDTLVISIYRPTGMQDSDTKNFIKHLQKILSDKGKSRKFRKSKIIIGGDFNIDIGKSNDKYTRDLIEAMVQRGLYPLIDKPTRIQGRTKTIIDNIYVNHSDILSSGIVDDLYISDHLTTYMTFKPAKSKIKIMKRRKVTEDAIQKMEENILTRQWDDIYEEQDVHKKWQMLTTVVQKELDDNCPIETVKYKEKIKQTDPPYMTAGLKVSQKNLRKLAKLALKKPDTMLPDGRSNQDIYKETRKNYNKVRRQMKRKYYIDKFNEAKHNSRDTWKIINELRKVKSKQNDINEIMTPNGTTTDKSEKISETFNKFYAGVGRMQAETIPDTEVNPLSFLRKKPGEPLKMPPALPCEILNAIKKLKKKSSQGWDGLPTYLILRLAPKMINVLTHNINKMLSSGIFPDSLKEAIVVPIHKKKSKTDPTNYRPVSLLSGFSKIAEKIIANRLQDYFENNNLFSNYQFGFRKQMSTADLILYMQEKLARTLADGRTAVLLFFDLAKAFDTLPWDILEKKLEKYNISGETLNLLRTYMTGRKQRVKVNGKLSNTEPLTIGVPQGSILGPLLFIIYSNDIVNAITSTIGLYADDTTALVEGETEQDAINKAKVVLNELGEWFASNRLSLSPTKCKFAIINPQLRSSRSKIKLQIYGQDMKEIKENTDCESNPFVGLLFSEKMDFKAHINMIRTKVNSGLYCLNQHKYLPKTAKINLYYSLIYSHLQYAAIALSGASKQITKQLLKLQKKAVRNIEDKEYNANTGPIFKKLKLLKYEDIIRLNCCIIGWQHFHGHLPKAISTLLETGSGRALHLKSTRIANDKIRKISPISAVTTEWNKLTLELKRIKNKETFKKNLIKTWIEHY